MSTWRRLREIFRPTIQHEVDDELAFHIDMRARELEEEGLDPRQARAIAEQRFGPVRPIEEALVSSTRRRRQRADRVEALSQLRQDVRYAIRSLRHSPMFTATAIVTLALGIGAAMAVFTVVNGVLVRPLPYRDPARIDMIWLSQRQDDGASYDLPLSSGFFSDIEREARGFDAMAAFRGWSYSLAADGGEAERVAGARVSPALFDVLGVRPIAGRAFTRAEAVPGGPAVALISHSLWQRRFGGDAGIVGKQVTMSGQSFTITGVMPPGFTFPRGAELPAAFQFAPRTDVWTPLVFDSSDVRNYGTQNLSVVGRLARGVSRERAEAELDAMMANFLRENAPTLKLDYHLASLIEQAGQRVRRGLLILLGAVTCVLLIAGANVASLLVARVTNRRRELAVRAALGAGRLRIARQLVTENVVLAGAGTIVGMGVAWWGTKGMLALVPGSLPRADDITVDWRVLGVAALVALVAGVVFGMAAAWSVRGRAIVFALRDNDARSGGSVARRTGRRALVAIEVALSLVLLIGAALLTRSFIELARVHPGFDPEQVLTASVSLPIAGRFDPIGDGPRWAATLNDITARLRRAPGVQAAGAVSSLPLTGAYESGGVRIPGQVYRPGEAPSAQYNVVSGDYFAAAGIRLITGRVFDASDDAPDRATIVLNRTAARNLFGSEQAAIGRELNPTFTFTRGAPKVVVGVVDDVRQTALDEAPAAQVYVPESQLTYPGLALVVRARGEPLSVLGAVRSAVRAVDPTATINDVRTMRDVMSESLARQRFTMTLVGTFAALALVMAIVGLHGVLALIVGQRRREIGVRLALGARPGDIVRLVLGEGARVTAAGIVLGLIGAYLLTRVLSELLYGVTATDVTMYALAAAVVVVVALAATWAPARRASRVDPRDALTAE